MQRIGPDGTRLTELAASAQVTKQTAGALVDQLERGGYVRRTPDPTDARARLVRIAERGAAAKPVADGVVADVEAEWRGPPRGGGGGPPPGGGGGVGGGNHPHPSAPAAPPLVL